MEQLDNSSACNSVAASIQVASKQAAVGHILAAAEQSLAEVVEQS